jgi:hypothetical protein
MTNRQRYTREDWRYERWAAAVRKHGVEPSRQAYNEDYTVRTYVRAVKDPEGFQKSCTRAYQRYLDGRD